MISSILWEDRQKQTLCTVEEKRLSACKSEVPSSSAASPAPPEGAAALAPVSSSRPPSELSGTPPPSEIYIVVIRSFLFQLFIGLFQILLLIRFVAMVTCTSNKTDLFVQLVLHVLPSLLLLSSLLILPVPPLLLLPHSLLLGLLGGPLLLFPGLLQPPLLLLSPQSGTRQVMSSHLRTMEQQLWAKMASQGCGGRNHLDAPSTHTSPPPAVVAPPAPFVFEPDVVSLPAAGTPPQRLSFQRGCGLSP